MTRLPENVIEDFSLRDKSQVFHDRDQAGGVLAGHLKELELSGPLVLAIPCGGVPVASRVCVDLGLQFDILLVRKLQIPGNTEAGFGACTTDGPVFLNHDLVESLGLSPAQIQEAEKKTRNELYRREKIFREGRPLPEVNGRDVVLVDDGLASGYTMHAAVGWVKEKKCRTVTVAAPTAHLSTAARLARSSDYLVCPNIRGGFSFAVADAYERWYDLQDDEVLDILRQMEKRK